MLPTLVTTLPDGPHWYYEVKYDGFRAIVYINGNDINIVSRNLNNLNEQFPEIIDFFQELQLPPTILDGELCVLENEFKANFAQIQKRGRLKDKAKIEQAITTIPVTFQTFDILMENNQMLLEKTYLKRKQHLVQLWEQLEIDDDNTLRVVHEAKTAQDLWDQIQNEEGEGIIIKHQDSKWEPGIRSKKWLKIKNMQIGSFFVLGYDETNSFFQIGCVYNGKVKIIGKVGQGFTKEEKEALVTIVKKNATKKAKDIYYVEPSICIEIEFLELSKNELRHPKFRRFRFDKNWEDCLWEAIQKVELN